MNLNSKIESETAKLDACNAAYEKLNIYNNIIQIKSLDDELKKNLFYEVKQYLRYTIEAIEEKAYQYYELNRFQIEKTINLLPIAEQLNLIRYFERELKNHGFEENLTWLKTLIKKKKIAYLWQENSYKAIPSIVAEASTYNLYCGISTLVVLFFIYTTVLFPAPCKWMECFDSKFVSYTESLPGNIIINSLLSFCSIDSDFDFNPINLKGVLILIVLKLIIIIVILNYIFQELKSWIKL